MNDINDASGRANVTCENQRKGVLFVLCMSSNTHL